MPMITLYLHLAKNFDEANRLLQNDFLILYGWFFNNLFVLNCDKCKFIILETSQISQSTRAYPKNV